MVMTMSHTNIQHPRRDRRRREGSKDVIYGGEARLHGRRDGLAPDVAEHEDLKEEDVVVEGASQAQVRVVGWPSDRVTPGLS